MSRERLVASLGPAVALALWLALGAGGLWVSLAPEERAALVPMVAGRAAFGFVWWLVGAGLAPDGSPVRSGHLPAGLRRLRMCPGAGPRSGRSPRPRT